jgi:hypothetical protein
MVEVIEAGELRGERRRFDRVTAAAVTVTADAVLLLTIALVGVPFLLFVFGDDITGTWGRLWPYVGSWVLACVSGAACAAAALALAGNATRFTRHAGATAALGAAVAAVLIALLLWRTPLLGPVGAIFVLANLLAAAALFTAKETEAPVFARFPTPDTLPLPDPAAVPEDDPDTLYRRPEPTAETRPTIDLDVRRTRPTAARRRPRGQAALHTLSGVRLPPRARRPAR